MCILQLQRQSEVEKRRKLKKIEWLRKMYVRVLFTLMV